MQLNASEISDLIKKEIEGFDFSAEARTEGTVISVSDGIVRIHGLADAQLISQSKLESKQLTLWFQLVVGNVS